MEIRKLSTWQELLEADRVIATSFLHKWNEDETRERRQAEAAGTRPRESETWALQDDDGRILAAIETQRRQVAFDGAAVDCGEVHMVGSLPEARGQGHIRQLMRAVLEDFRGCPFAMLIPFSCSFYRKFGFELASSVLTQKASIGQFAGFRCTYQVRQLTCEAEVAEIRRMYERLILTRNLCSLRSDRDWRWRGGGAYGEPDFWHGDNPEYTYLFRDGDGALRAYLKFLFVPGPNGPFTGTMEISDLFYDSPEALRNVFGFLYGMRAKITDVCLYDRPDLAAILPDGDKVERTLGGHWMARVLDPAAVLRGMRHPADAGRYVLDVTDDFLPDQNGRYAVSYADGHAAAVERTDDAPELTVSVQTLCQLAVGRIALEDALFRDGTELRANRPVLERVFVRKDACAR